jgi:hypothetical protein
MGVCICFGPYYFHYNVIDDEWVLPPYLNICVYNNNNKVICADDDQDFTFSKNHWSTFDTTK